MTDYNSFITTAEIAGWLNISRQRVHQIIKDHELGVIKKGSMLLVNLKDYNKYILQRRRRDLAAAAGRLETKFIKTAIHDTVCNKCEAFAINWKGVIACENEHIQSGNPK